MTAPPARRSRSLRLARFLRTPKGYALVTLLALAALAAPGAGPARVLPEIGGAVAASVLIEIWAVWYDRGRPFFPSSALISGLIVALVLRPEQSWTVFVVAGGLASASKHLLRVRCRHVFNPAAVGLLLTVPLFSGIHDWWGTLPGLPLPFVVALLVAGALVTDRVNKLPQVLAFLVSYFGLFTLATFVGDPGRLAEVFRAPFVNAAIFFACFMLTDPPTAPSHYPEQVLSGVLVAAVSFIVYVTWRAEYFLLAGLLTGNVWLVWCRRPAASATAPRRPDRGAPPPPVRVPSASSTLGPG